MPEHTQYQARSNQNYFHDPSHSPYNALGRSMARYAQMGCFFTSVFLVLLILFAIYVRPAKIETNEVIPTLGSALIIIFLIFTGLAGISLFIMHILFLVNLNEAGRPEYNFNLRRSFSLEIILFFITILVFLGGIILMRFLHDIMGKAIWGENLPKYSSWIIGLSIFSGELLILRIFRLISTSFLVKWAKQFGMLIYDEKWGDLKKKLIREFRIMKTGQILGLIFGLSFLSPYLYYYGMLRASEKLEELAPHFNEFSAFNGKNKN
ncbi:MAG: hypothetical protein ACTSW3_03200 [Promethearchaeota archaeon]